MLRDTIKTETVIAMKAGEKPRVAALRLIAAKVKDRDIELRGKDAGDDDAMVIDVLQKMAKQRRESIQMYEEGGRTELAEQEKSELAVIEEFLPRQLSEEETANAVDDAVAEVGASSIRDMGKVMGILKAKYTGQMDFGSVGPMVKGKLG